MKLWDRIWLGLFILFYPGFMFFCTAAMIKYELPIAMSMAVLIEMARLLMKTHAFVRSNAPRVLKYKPHVEDQVLCPDVSKFLYFSFAPILIYQDDYPRTKHIRWKYVSKCFVEFIAIVFFMSFLIERFFMPTFKDYGIKPFTWQEIIIIISANFVPSLLILLSIGYQVLHVWQNAFAEMLRFADRLFYKDWWTSGSYERYYRTWNVTVHDWLYTYIYKDFYEIVLPKNKIAAKYMVFFVSAFFHDYVLGFAFRFYLPILFINFFIVGVGVTFLKIRDHSVGNIFLWYSLALGDSINVCFYCMEYYSRQNCPVENETLSSYFIPRLFFCK